MGEVQKLSVSECYRNSKVKITLRLAVYRQSVRLGAKPHEAEEQSFFSTEPLRS
jgi:hypothetical protein